MPDRPRDGKRRLERAHAITEPPVRKLLGLLAGRYARLDGWHGPDDVDRGGHAWTVVYDARLDDTDGRELPLELRATKGPEASAGMGQIAIFLGPERDARLIGVVRLMPRDLRLLDGRLYRRLIRAVGLGRLYADSLALEPGELGRLRERLSVAVDELKAEQAVAAPFHAPRRPRLSQLAATRPLEPSPAETIEPSPER